MVEDRRNHWKGLDVGTANLVAAERNGNGQAVLRLKRSSFIELPADARTKLLVQRMKAPHVIHGTRMYVFGDQAYELAGSNGHSTPKAVADANSALPAMKALLGRIADSPANGNEECFSAVSADHSEPSVVQHQNLFDALVHALNCRPSHIIDGHSVPFAEPAEEDFTGIGIFCGGGLFDICVAYKSLPAVFFSTSGGGEWVDLKAATDLGVKSAWTPKPRRNSAAKASGDENEIARYYRNLIDNTLHNIKGHLPPAANLQQFPDPISLLFSGATSMTGNFIELVRTVYRQEEGSAVKAAEIPVAKPAVVVQAPKGASIPAPPLSSDSDVEDESSIENDAVLQLEAGTTEEPLIVDRERRIVDFRRYLPGAGRGLDVGTSNVVGAVRAFTGASPCNIQRNAFLDVRSDVFTEKLLMKLGVERYDLGNKRFVIGNPAFEFANIFEKSTRRPMKNGVMSPTEPDGLFVEGLVIQSVLGKAPSEGEICAYSIQADPIDVERNAVYHTGAIETILRRLGYAPRPLLEGMAVIYAELAEEDYTGIGISCGGGMFNICIAYKSLPALAFSISRGGDWIDANVAQSLGLPSSQVCAIKESGVDLNDPKGRIEEAICIYYRNLIHYSIDTIRERFESAQNMPAFRAPISVVCSGGTSMIKGFIDVFREEFNTINFPIAVKEIRRAKDPLRTVARGCLEAALEETRARTETPAPALKLERAEISTVSAAPPRASLPAAAAKVDPHGKNSPWWVVVPASDHHRQRPLEGPACA